MKNTYRTVCILSLFFYVFFTVYAIAASNIDTSFGKDGFTLQDFKIGNDEGYAIAVQKDGKILVAGYSSSGAAKDLIVSRFSEDGTIDTDFNAAGVFSISLGSGDTIGRSLVVQEDGNILVGASSYDGRARVAVLRLTPEGNLDTSFNADGYVILPIEDGKITSTAIQLSEKGEVFVSSTMEPESSFSYAVFAKYNSSGELDTSFGNDGQTTYVVSPNDVKINSLLIQSDGTILAGGSLSKSDQPQAILLQLTPNGAVNTSFGTEGRVSLDLGGTSSVINSLAAASDDTIIVAGAINNGKYNEAFVGKRNSDGSAAVDFATSGTYTTTYSLENAINGVSVTEDGTILAVGFLTAATSKDVFVLSLLENSETQTTAVTFVATDIAQNDDVAYAALALNNDTLLAAGSSSNGENLDVALLRFTDNDSLSSGDGGATGSTEGLVTAGFRITTRPISSVTGVSAVSGGSIEQFSLSGINITVTQKGVVFGTMPNPTYSIKEVDDEGANTDNTTNDTTSNTGNSTGTNTSNNTSNNTNDNTTSTDTTSVSTNGVFSEADSGGTIFPDSNNYSIVRLGNTNDGEGLESYISGVENITPGTTYYLRAYAVLSNGEVIYGNEYRFSTDDACFIATAAYGSILEKHVVLLRQFRDSFLLTHSAGQKFVSLYYAYSPPIADIIRSNSLLKTIVKICLFPIVILAMFFVKTTLITKLICLGAGLIFGMLLCFKYLISFKVSTT